MKKILSILFAIILLLSAFGHVFSPDMYAPLIPDFIPEWFANGLSFLTEALVGVLLLIPKYRKWGGIGFMLLMIGFLPVHIWDLSKDIPFMGSKLAASIRVAVQFLLIYGGYYIYKSHAKVAH